MLLQAVTKQTVVLEVLEFSVYSTCACLLYNVNLFDKHTQTKLRVTLPMFYTVGVRMFLVVNVVYSV